MTPNNPIVHRFIGVLILFAGVALIILSRDGQPLVTVIGVVLMAVGFWLSYVKNEIRKMRSSRDENQ